MLSMMFAAAFSIGAASDQTLELATALATRAEMHERFTRATLIQTGLINGNLESARHWARQLAMIAPEPEDFADLRARFGDLARGIAGATTLTEAARRTGNLANACGACHELHGVRPDRFASTLEVPGGASTTDRMARHIWAADRMWEGLVGRSESSWFDGASALIEAPLTRDELATDADGARNLATEVVALGREALDTHRWSGRAAVYGRFLARCAECHALYRINAAD